MPTPFPTSRRAVQCLMPALVMSAVLGTTALRAQSPIARRLPGDSIWRRVWSVGGDTVKETFIEPRHIAVSGDLVAVLDMGSREVHGLDARTGATRFVLKATGQGPGEFRRPAMLTATPTGFAVLDHANARLTAYDRRGKLQWDAVLADVFSIQGLCVRANSHIIATKFRRDSSVAEFDSTGRRLAIKSVPWTDMVRDAVGFAYAHFTSSASSTGDCVLAPIFGSEWGVIPQTGAPHAYRLVEPGPKPVVVENKRILDYSLSKVTVERNQQSDSPHATHNAMINGDTVILNAAKTKTFPYLWLDYYRASTGAYVFSRRLPFSINAATVAPDGTVYATRIESTSAWVVALKPATLEEVRKKSPPTHK